MGCGEISEYYSENVLASNASIVADEKFESFKKMHCDGMVFLHRNDQVFHLAVEYEHSIKYARRYERLFFDYWLEGKIVAVLYLCRDKKVLKRVMEAEKRETKDRKKKTYFALVDDILSSEGVLKFKTSCGKQTLEIS